MTDGREERSLVADEIGEVRRGQELRRKALQAGLIVAEGEPHPEEGVLMALPSEPPRPRSPSETLEASGGTLAVDGGGYESEPIPAAGSLSVRFLILAVLVLVLFMIWREIRRSRKEDVHG